MIEAMACGTPVVAWRCGSVPEVIDDGVTGYIVASKADEAVAAVPQAALLNRRAIRDVFDRRFTGTVMASDYLHLYQTLTAGIGFEEPISVGAK